MFRKEGWQNDVWSVSMKHVSNRATLLLLVGLLSSHTSLAQTLGWTWTSGSSSSNQAGSYGTKGTASSSNVPGGRRGGLTWTDSNGDLWLFGGFGVTSSATGYLNDLWKYDASTGNWTWVSGNSQANGTGVYGTKGTASSTNIPGGRLNAMGWIDSNDDLWLFGGNGFDKNQSLGRLNDLWKYDVSADEWTWMKGQKTEGNPSIGGSNPVADHTPGARSASCAWQDTNGDFWLFGGNGRDFSTTNNGYLRDVWKYDVSTGNWSFEHGATSIDGSPQYTTPIRPGGIAAATSVSLSDGDLLIFGGVGYIGTNSGRLNDLWRFDVSTKTWSFRQGSKSLDAAAAKTGSPVLPSGLSYACSWLDASNNLWLYGGITGSGSSSDLWKYSLSGNTWTWKGDGSASFGTNGTFDLNNHPGPRYFATSSQGSNGELWLFGGFGSGYENDLWKPRVLTAIENLGGLTATFGAFQMTSTKSAGDALQDEGDIVAILEHNGTSRYIATNLPSGSHLSGRINRSWKVDKKDENSNGGILSMVFNIGSIVSADRSYYLLHRTGTSGDFSFVNTTDYDLVGTSVKFWLDLDEVTSGDYYAAGWSDEGAGYALNFDKDVGNIRDSLVFPIDLDPASSDFTIECWIKPAFLNKNHVLFKQRFGAGQGEIFLRLEKDGTLGSFLGGHLIKGTQKLVANKWQHVALSSKVGTLNFYIDGSLDTSYSVLLDPCAGVWTFATSSGFGGEVEEIRIWDDERTEVELRNYMHKPLFGNESNLIGYYRFDEISGTNLPDVSVNRENATLYNFSLSGTTSNWVSSTAPVVAEAQVHHIKGPGSCLVFDGSDDYVQVSSFLNPSSTNWTMESWFNSSSLTSVMLSQLDGSGTGRQLMRLENGVLKTTVDGVGITGTTAVSTGEWHHYALTYDGTTINMYLDGLLEASSNVSVTSATGNYQIGCNKGRSIFFEGKLDELRFWSATRTQAEIQDNMYASVAADASGLLAYYSCDHFSGTSLEDASSNTNTATLNNFPLNCWTSAADREPFKTIKAGSHNSGSTWKDGAAPSSSNDRLAVFHNMTLSATGTYNRMQVNSGVTVTTSADVTVNGDVIVNGSLTGSNKLILGGSAKQSLGGSGSLGALQVNNSNDVSLDGDLTISGALTLTSGDIEVNNHTLTLSGTTSHGSSTSYLKLNGTGNVKATVGSDPVILPVGRNPYLPIVIDDGGGAEYTVGVADKVYSNPVTQSTELTQDCVSETWTIQSDQSVSNVSVQLGWDASEETTGFQRIRCAVAYWENGVSSSWTKGTGGGAATGSDPYFQTAVIGSMTTNLYYFGVGSPGSPLPVELTDFTAQWIDHGKKTRLLWQTSSEVNNSHFEIERSMDGHHFEMIGQIEGNGTSAALHFYQFDDQNLPVAPERIYYRLKQVDFDGQYEYSSIVSLENRGTEGASLVIYPNPASTTIHISGAEAFSRFMIYNSVGTEVQSAQSAGSLDISKLTPGNYLLVALPNQNGNNVFRAKLSVTR